ncbi:MAG TPA: ABC transporter permease [Methanoregulaceae archaeon]|nr:ABC transporter permease [Methanoregulaceae archaeon]
MDWGLFLRSIRVITEKNMRIYYVKGPVVVFGLLFPLIMFLTFFIGRDLDLVLFFPGFLGMMLFFTASSVGPLITPWEKREKTYERLLSLPVILESIIIGDMMAGALFGIAITTVVFVVSAMLFQLPILNAALLFAGFVLGSVTFAALGSLLASPTTDNPSNIMMLSSLVRLPLIFISGIFIPLGQLTGWFFVLTSLSPLTYLVDLFHAALNGDAVYPPWVDVLVLVAVILLFAGATKVIQQRNLVKGI